MTRTTYDGINDDATPEESVSWVLTRRDAGIDPSVYCDEAVRPQVRAAFGTHGVPEPHWWVAQYDGIAELLAGAVAKQCKTTPGWDESVVADCWPGVDPEAAPTPEENDMSTTSANGRAGLSWQQGARHVVQVTYDPAGGDPDLPGGPSADDRAARAVLGAGEGLREGNTRIRRPHGHLLRRDPRG
jgi:hypothetical protein